MLTIKLSEIGKTNKKVFRLIISEKGRDPYGNALEILGSYNPYSKELQTKGERIKYWLSKGAQMTDSVNNLLVDHKVVEGQKVKASKAAPQSEKRAAQLKAKVDKKAAASAPAPVETTPEAEAVSENEAKAKSE